MERDVDGNGGGGAAAASPTDPDFKRPAFLELFFDLVYVFALVTLATTLAENLTWTGAAETLVLLLAFTMIWALTVWGADSLDLERPSGQGQLIWVAAASLLLAAAAADSYGDHALLFAVTYVFIHASTSVYYSLVDSTRTLLPSVIRIQIWEGVAGVGWIGGALVGGSGQLPIWALAVVVEYSAAGFGWPVPGIGRSRARDWRLAGGRVAERYRQFVIVALGVSIFVTGTTFSMSEYTMERAWALAVVFGTVVLMWRIPGRSGTPARRGGGGSGERSGRHCGCLLCHPAPWTAAPRPTPRTRHATDSAVAGGP
ncbi:low temperature requirement protein A [Micromonospora ureilytica]|uniref:low temperature requirement protein A n=1 Tax=Micromonospora ureilytica TaxID=709868 RepID=UPI002E0F981A|nr:low temperature requirement protein A [Micromonospora ureilytica]